ncbi:hypothetical protein HOLleu_24455 [Holothuria leucospilota]|uniref:Uncharacterized protein n=1 Tax=Holothuria leucospilota TaxID=206669 RepID=A0A9Q1BVF4_HOLLE|nr:hypothetical protein HOLleu_24455 [Holothuria leucospilota]
MGSRRSRRFYCLLEISCAFIIAFGSSYSFTQRENNGKEEDNSQIGRRLCVEDLAKRLAPIYDRFSPLKRRKNTDKALSSIHP